MRRRAGFASAIVTRSRALTGITSRESGCQVTCPLQHKLLVGCQQKKGAPLSGPLPSFFGRRREHSDGARMAARRGVDRTHSVEHHLVERRSSSERYGEVHSSDEQGIETLNRSNGIEVIQRRRIFNLRDHCHGAVGVGNEFSHRAGRVACGARRACIAPTLGAIAGADRDTASLSSRRNVWNENPGSAEVKRGEYVRRMVTLDAHQGREIRGASRQKGRVQRGAIKWGVFGIQTYAIERGVAKNLDDRGMRSLDEGAYKEFACKQSLPEGWGDGADHEILALGFRRGARTGAAWRTGI